VPGDMRSGDEAPGAGTENRRLVVSGFTRAVPVALGWWSLGAGGGDGRYAARPARGQGRAAETVPCARRRSPAGRAPAGSRSDGDPEAGCGGLQERALPDGRGSRGGRVRARSCSAPRYWKGVEGARLRGWRRCISGWRDVGKWDAGASRRCMEIGARTTTPYANRSRHDAARGTVATTGRGRDGVSWAVLGRHGHPVVGPTASRRRLRFRWPTSSTRTCASTCELESRIFGGRMTIGGLT